jgi:hypothetical protein
MLRKERERERKKFLIEQQRQQALKLNSQAETELINELARKSKYEIRVARQLNAIRHEKEIMKRNRVLRDQQYQEQRHRDYENAMKFEFEKSERMRKSYVGQANLLSQQYQEILKKKAQIKLGKHYAMAGHIIHDIVDFAEKVRPFH